MTGSADTLRLADQGTLLLAEADPLRAVRTLARGIRNQSTGGKLAVLRAFVQQLAEHDPEIAPTIAADLSELASRKP